MMAIYCCQSAISQTWSSIKGVQAQDISIGSEGEVWITGKDNSIMRWNGSGFDKMKGSARRISAGADGIPWIVNTAGKIAHYDADNDNWIIVNGSAKDISVGADGSIWIVGTKTVDGGFEVSKWNSDEESWNKMDFGAVRIAVDGSGNPWMVNDQHKIFTYVDDEQVDHEGEMLDVGIGADGSVWAITTNKEIVKLEDDNWVTQEGTAICIAATSEGEPWILSEDGIVHHYAEAASGDEDTEEASDEEEKIAPKEKASRIEKSDDIKKEANEKGPSPNKQTENGSSFPKSGTPVEFYNSGKLPVEIYRSSSDHLGELVTEIRPQSRVKIPVNVGDEFEVGINKEIGRHPKIYITNTRDNISLFGNGPLKDVQFLAEKFSILDYQSSQAGVDLTKYNPEGPCQFNKQGAHIRNSGYS